MTMLVSHVIVLLAGVTWTVRALVRQGRRPTEKRVVLGVTAGLLVAFAGVAASTTTCGGPMPVAEWAVPATCLTAVLLFVRPTLAGRVACGVFVAAALVLPLRAAMSGAAGGTVTGPATETYSPSSCR